MNVNKEYGPPASFPVFSNHHEQLKNPVKFLQQYGDPVFSDKMAKIAEVIKMRKLVDIPPRALQISDVIISSTIDPRDQNAIAAKFNRVKPKDSDQTGYKPIIGSFSGGGTWIHPGFYLLAHFNNKPYLIPPQSDAVNLAANISILGAREKGNDGLHHQNELLFGMNGSYVVNIPRGSYGKVKLNKAPALLGEGVHVILDPTFEMDKDSAKSLVNTSDPIIQWGSILIAQVPEGKLLKLRHGQKFYFLESREQPYIYNDPNIILAEHSLVNTSEEVIQHGSLTRVMVGSNNVAIVKHNNNMALLYPQDDPYILGANYTFDELINTSEQMLELTSAKMPNKLALRTQDNFILHVDLMLTYRLPCLEFTLKHLGSKNIQPIIINKVVSEIERVVRGLSFANYMSASQAVIDQSQQNESSVHKPAILRDQLNLSAERLIQDRLAREYGIFMTQVAILHADIAPDIAKEMEKSALANAVLQTELVSMDTAIKITEKKLLLAKINAEIEYQKEIPQAKILAEYPIMLDVKKAIYAAEALKNNTKIIDTKALQIITGGVFENSMTKTLAHPESNNDLLLISSKKV